MEKRLHSKDAIFDPTPDEDDDQNFSPAVYLPSPEADPAVQVETSDWNENAIKRMKAALNLLDDRSRRILEERWLNENKMTLHELAAEYQVSAERIRQLEANAIKKLSNTMAL